MMTVVSWHHGIAAGGCSCNTEHRPSSCKYTQISVEKVVNLCTPTAIHRWCCPRGGLTWGDWGDLVTGGYAVIRWVVHVSDCRANRIGQLELTHQLLQQLHSLISAQVHHDSFHLGTGTWQSDTWRKSGKPNIWYMFTYIGQEAGVTVDSWHTDEEVQDDLEVFWPAVCQCCPHILYLWPCKLIPVL